MAISLFAGAAALLGLGLVAVVVLAGALIFSLAQQGLATKWTAWCMCKAGGMLLIAPTPGSASSFYFQKPCRLHASLYPIAVDEGCITTDGGKGY